MKKKENEFAKALDKLELEVQIRDQKKAIASRRLKKIETIREEKKEAKERSLEQEAEAAKSGAAKDKMGVAISILIVAAVIVIPYYRKDPVNFWFYVIVGFCYLGFYVMQKYSK